MRITYIPSVKNCFWLKSIIIKSLQHVKYIEDYNLIDIEEGNEKLVLELYDYILTVNTNDKLEEFISDKYCE